MRSNKLEAVVGVLLIVIIGLILTLAVAAFMLDTGQPAKMFPLVLPELWKAAYGQTQQPQQQQPPLPTTEQLLPVIISPSLSAQDSAFARFLQIFKMCSN